MRPLSRTASLITFLLILTASHRASLSSEKAPPAVSKAVPLSQPPQLAAAAFWVTDASETMQPRLYHLNGLPSTHPLATCVNYLHDNQIREIRLMYVASWLPQERAYWQEKSTYGLASPALVNNLQVDTAGLCWKFVVTVGHLSGATPKSSFLITAQPFRWYDNTPLPGPWLCVTNLGGAHPGFTLGVASAGPILAGTGCARQPSADGWSPPNRFSVPPVTRKH